MRVKIDFYVNRKIEAYTSFNEAMTGFIYKCIATSDKKYATKLHDEGIASSGCKKFSYFTYSITQNNIFSIYQLNVGTATLTISSLIDETIINFVKGLIRIGKIQIFGNSFNIESISYLKCDYRQRVYKLISPMYVSTPEEKIVDKIMIPDLIISNVLTKYEALYKKMPNNLDIEVKVLNMKPFIIRYKTSKYKAYFANIALKADKSVIKMAYEAGIGSKNGLGLGMLF